MTLHASIAQGRESAFSPAEYERRVASARAKLQESGIDVLVVTGPENIFYLTGQQTPGYYVFQALVLPVEGEASFVIRQLEAYNFAANTFISDCEVFQDGDDPVEILIGVLKQRGRAGGRIGIEKRGWFLPVAFYEALQSRIGEISDASGLIESLRAVKSPLELEKIERAAGYVDAGMRAGAAAIKTGATENDIAAAMLGTAIAAGSEYVGMEPLVSSGPRSGVPHATWRRRRLQPGDPISFAMAACHDRYHAALMRTAWIGEPPAVALRMMEACEEALEAALATIRPGAPCEAPHIACQAVIDRHGYADHFRKRGGYSMGISFAPDWGEGSVLSLYKGVKHALEPGMAFHVVPALRMFGEFAVGSSEMAVVTETGCRVLGRTDRALLRLPPG